MGLLLLLHILSSLSFHSRCFLPKIEQPKGKGPVYEVYVLARELNHDQSLPDPAFSNLSYLPKPPATGKPNRARKAANNVSLPAIKKSARFVTPDQALHDKASANSRSQSNLKAGKKSTRADVPSASVKQEAHAKSLSKLSTSQSYLDGGVKKLQSQPKLPAGRRQTKIRGISSHVRLSTIPEEIAEETGVKKGTKPSRIPVLLRNGNNIRFNNPPKRGPDTAKKTKIPVRRPSGQHGVASGDSRPSVLDSGNRSTRNGR